PNRLQHSTPDHFFSDRPISQIPLRELFVSTISYRLHYGQSQTPVLEIIPDPLYRIAWPDIGFSDLANLTRCKQAAPRYELTHSRGVTDVTALPRPRLEKPQSE